jgi:hypothetical protein
MHPKKNRGTKTEALSLRLDPKTKFILEFASRINGQTITTTVERAIRASCDEVRTERGEFEPASNWKSFWDPDEGVRTLNLLGCSGYPTTYDEDELRSFIQAHKAFFYTKKNESIPNTSLVPILWPKIEDYRQIWIEQRDKDYWAAGSAMAADLASAKVEPPTWPPTNMDDKDDEIPF